MPGEGIEVGVAFVGVGKVQGRTGRDKGRCAGKLRGNKKCVIVVNGKATPVKGPVVVEAEGKAVRRMVVAEQREVSDMAG